MKAHHSERGPRRWKLGVRVALVAAALSPLWMIHQEGRAQDGDTDRYAFAALEARRPSELASAPAPDDPFLAEGRRVYVRYCAPCHGETGAGDGLAADYMRPRPRDFTAANYAFRTTRSGELPADADLFRVISRGVPGTTMPAWGEGIFTLTERERWQVVYYVKTLSGIFWEEYTNPYRSVEEGEAAPILEIGAPPERTEALLERGRALYLDQEAGGCARCHGEEGRGDGPAAAEMFDELGQPARPYDLTNPWRNKNGTAVQDIYRTLSSGISGTPMADFMDGIPEDRDRWALAYYAQSLIEERTIAEGTLHARRVEGDLPDDPDDAAWESCAPFGVAMMGQYAVAPRWQAPATDYVRLCALHNEREIAIRVEWDDPFMDTGDAEAEPDAIDEPPADEAPVPDATADEEGTSETVVEELDEGEPVPAQDEAVEGAIAAETDDAETDDTETDDAETDGAETDDAETTEPASDVDEQAPPPFITIAAMNARAQAESIPDRMVFQMPAGPRSPDDAQRPRMFMGDEAHPVHAFTWSAQGGGSIGEANASGEAEDYTPQEAGSVQVTGRSAWHRGRWRVVFHRTLTTPEQDDAQLGPGVLMPFDLRTWDGSAGERGAQCATSSWHYVYLEMPTPMRAYVRGAVATLAGYLLIGMAWWRVSKRRG